MDNENGDGTQAFKNWSMPDGKACQPDETLKNIHEIEWLHSPSDLNMRNLREEQSHLKRKLSGDEDLSDNEDGGLLKAKVTHYAIVIEKLAADEAQQWKSNQILDSDEEVEILDFWSKMQRKVSIWTAAADGFVGYIKDLPSLCPHRWGQWWRWREDRFISVNTVPTVSR